MDAAHGAAAPALSKLSAGIREYSLFQGVLRALDHLRAGKARYRVVLDASQ